MSSSPFGSWGFSDWSFPQRCSSPARCPVADLSQQFRAQTLEQLPSSRSNYAPSPRAHTPVDCRRSQSTYTTTSSLQQLPPRALTPVVNESYSQTQSQTQAFTECAPSHIRRQRQRALRDQCSSAHLEAISALVARMIDQKEQCDVSTSSTSSESSVDDEDEPVSPVFRTRSDSQTSDCLSDRTGSVASSAGSVGRRSMECRITKKSGRPRSGAFSLSRRTQ